MNNVTAAMALEQLKKLPEFMSKRAAVHKFYDENLKNITWLLTPEPMPQGWETSYYFYHIQILNGKRDQLATYLRENGVYTTYRYFPLHRVPAYGVTGSFPNADYATDNTLCLPLHQSLTKSDIEFIVSKIKEFGERYC